MTGFDCDAITDGIRCAVVGVKGFWARTESWENTGHFVAYCAKPGHEANVRRRFAPVDPPMPVFLHEDPAFVDHPADATVESEYDPIDAAKWTRDREESWTAS